MKAKARLQRLEQSNGATGLLIFLQRGDVFLQGGKEFTQEQVEEIERTAKSLVIVIDR